MRTRIDPTRIIAQVGGTVFEPSDADRSLCAWVIKARQAGWRPVVEENHTPMLTCRVHECGRVAIEGVQYVIRYGRRLRHLLVGVIDGEPVEREVLAYAAWAEPAPTAAECCRARPS
jgi:hypothetical protein